MVLEFDVQAENCRWVFAYGSLMWRPGFEYDRVLPARLSGYHRRLCVFSHHYRGTDEKPGLVLGLDRGGSCAGVAYEVGDDRWAQVLDYVRKREMITGVYRELVKSVLVEGEVLPINAVTYAVNRGHPQCAPTLSVEETMNYIQQGHGLSGSCVDYVANTIAHLRGLGVRDQKLEKLEPFLKT